MVVMVVVMTGLFQDTCVIYMICISNHRCMCHAVFFQQEYPKRRVAVAPQLVVLKTKASVNTGIYHTGMYHTKRRDILVYLRL